FGFDLFISKLSADLAVLSASTFLGAGGDDFSEAIRVNGDGDVYVTGWTMSAGFPTTPGAYRTSFNGGAYDAFVSRLDDTLTTLTASTFLGGTQWDFGYSMALDEEGYVYVAGHTASSGFPTTPGAYDESYSGVGGEGVGDDSFVSKFDSDLASLVASTFLGDAGWENVTFMEADGVGNIYVGGATSSAEFPTTPGAYDCTYSGGATNAGDAFVSRFNTDLTNLSASTFIGGDRNEVLGSIGRDASGNVYVAGATNSEQFPTTPGAYDESYNGPTVWSWGGDVFVLKVDELLSADCNLNEIPDPCDLSCGPSGGNCDVAGCGESDDCNTNGVLDVCDVAAGDCNANDIPDDCDIAGCAGDPACDDCDANDVPDGCDIAGGAIDDNVNGIPDECEMVPPEFPSDLRHQARKHRYISIDPSPNYVEVAYKVELVEMLRCAGDLRRTCSVDADCPNVCDNDSDIACTGDPACTGGSCVETAPCVHHPDEGASWWVLEPQQEPLGCRLPGGCTDADWFARLAATPHFQAWNTFGVADSSLLHISDCQITPVATYAVRACAPPTGDVCSDRLMIGTILRPPPGNYGDVVGAVDPVTTEFDPPNQILNVGDISGYLLTNLNYGLSGDPKPQAHWTWVDMEGQGAPYYRPQAILNVGDLNQILFGLMGRPYSWAGNNADPGDCP
ncbi:MAG: SBBP repeat-containing protein, partial [Phycisphaerales bacterium]